VRNKIRPCWNTIGGGRDQNMIITLIVEMNRDGTPVKAELMDTGRYTNDPNFRAAADAVHRAIMNPRCQPWPLSPEKYNSWRRFVFNFDPRAKGQNAESGSGCRTSPARAPHPERQQRPGRGSGRHRGPRGAGLGVRPPRIFQTHLRSKSLMVAAGRFNSSAATLRSFVV
jgi:hypothetical protein